MQPLYYLKLQLWALFNISNISDHVTINTIHTQYYLTLNYGYQKQRSNYVHLDALFVITYTLLPAPFENLSGKGFPPTPLSNIDNFSHG